MINDTYIRLRRLADIQAQIDVATVQFELDLQPEWHYEPRDTDPTEGNLALPAFLQIQAE
jgi:hypothetical protein